MSSFNDPRVLSLRDQVSTAHKPVVKHEMKCKGCGYNLIGLEIGSPCPECGRTISVLKPRGYRNYIDCPIPYLRLMSLGFWLLAIGGLGLFLGGFGLFFRVNKSLVGPMTLCGAAMWIAGVGIITRPIAAPPEAENHLRGEWKTTRLATLLTQPFWLVYGACITYIVMVQPAPGVADAMVTAAVVAMFVAIAGVAPTALLLANYCDWASDSDRAHKLRSCVWMMGAAGAWILIADFTTFVPTAISILGDFAWMFRLFSFLFSMSFFVAVFYIVWSTLGMAQMSVAAIDNHRTQVERDRRRHEKMVREREEHARRLANMPMPREETLIRKVGTPPPKVDKPWDPTRQA